MAVLTRCEPRLEILFKPIVSTSGSKCSNKLNPAFEKALCEYCVAAGDTFFLLICHFILGEFEKYEQHKVGADLLRKCTHHGRLTAPKRIH